MKQRDNRAKDFYKAIVRLLVQCIHVHVYYMYMYITCTCILHVHVIYMYITCTCTLYMYMCAVICESFFL